MSDTPTFLFAVRNDLDQEIFTPRRGEPLATGWDVRAAQFDKKDLILRPGTYFRIPLGFRAFCPAGWSYELHPRSSSFAKKGMHTLIGIIDETFPLECQLIGQYIPDVNSLGKDLVIKFGDPIGQIIPVKRQEMNIELVSNERIDQLYAERKAVRVGGVGSTDNNR